MSQQDEQNIPSAESEVLTLLKRMQQQLGFLEKKIDTLINQAPAQQRSDRPFKDRPPFQKRFRSFGHSHHHGEGRRDREHGSPERGFSQRRSFDRPHGDQQPRTFGQRRKPFSHRRKDRE